MLTSTINTAEIERLQKSFQDYISECNNRYENNNQKYVMTYPILKSKNGKHTLITKIISDIRTKAERKLITNKKELPVAYFSARHMVGDKLDENVKRHSGLIISDIDSDENPDTDFIKLKTDLCNDKFTLICFNSPRGGIKVIFNTNISKLEHHKAYYESIRIYLLKNYTITKIDTSGCNIARACFLPYDSNCYFNPHSSKYCLDDKQIEDSIIHIKLNKLRNSLSKVILQVGYISYDEHYNNIINLLKKRTEVGLYKNIFNNYRYYNIQQGVMDTSVPFLEILILKNSLPYRLNWNTTIDEHYFKSNTQKQLNVIDIGCKEGIEVCKVGFKKDHIIKEHYRAKTLSAMTIKLIFNNPFCHLDRLLQVIKVINYRYCEDPNPIKNPKPDDEEVKNIVMGIYNKFIAGELDFSTVINKKNGKTAKKYIFRSKDYVNIDASLTQIEACRTFQKGKRDLLMANLHEAIITLQDGNKITRDRIADYIGVHQRTLRRHITDDYKKQITDYNKSIKAFPKQSGKPR